MTLDLILYGGCNRCVWPVVMGEVSEQVCARHVNKELGKLLILSDNDKLCLV
jgi:hypothetical protein